MNVVGPAGAAESLKKLRLAYAGWEIGTAVAYIGVDAGLFKQHGWKSTSCRFATRLAPACSR